VDKHVAYVPAALLLDPHLTPAAKVLWMALQLYPEASLAELEARTGLSRPTLRKGLAGPAARLRPPSGPRVPAPAALLADPTLGSGAKVLYGQLQATSKGQGQSGRFTYGALSLQTSLSPKALRGAMAELAGAGWVRLTQKHRLSPIRYALGSPAWRRSQAEATTADRRLQRKEYKGEAIMQEYLSLLIDSDQFIDNARPGFLINPLTAERLEFDRFYQKANVAFEFHGAQHFHKTAKFSQEAVDSQRVRDLIKAGLCHYLEIHLVTIDAEHLSLQGITKKIAGCMPLRDLEGHEALVDQLERASIAYVARARAAARP
jgi:hypothetical protein